MRFIGLDAGSVSVKLVVLDERGEVLHRIYRRHKGHPLKVALAVIEEVTAKGTTGAPERSADSLSLSVTGSAGRLIASVLGVPFTNELVAQVFSVRKLFPRVRTIFELGGEDSKLILLDNKGMKDFSMNSVCAAGTGSFLDQQAERLRLTINEFSDLGLISKNPARIAGRCSVFAKSDMIHLQQIATPVEDIVAGLCFAVARNYKGAIVRGRSLEEPVSFHGGVAANKGVVRAFREVFCFGEFHVPDDHAFMCALGAVFKDRQERVTHPFDLKRLRSFVESSKLAEQGYLPLASQEDDFFQRHGKGCGDQDVRIRKERLPRAQDSRIPAYLGIDIGSISTNLAVIDEQGALLAKRYLMTAGRPIEAVRQGLREIGEEVGEIVDIRGVGTTGSGRYMIADYVGADIVKNEITAQATAAVFIDKDVDTIFEIGGQDSKFISLQTGVILDFEMNKACAAGTGSFLEEQAEKLGISVKGEFAEAAFCAGNPCRLGERCTVFMENSLMANLQRGAGKDDLLAGLAYSIVQNYITKVVAGRQIGERIFFQGGVAFNTSVVAAFENYLGKKITVPPHHDVTGAIGMALIAMRHMLGRSVTIRSHGETGIPDAAIAHKPRGGGADSTIHPVTSFKGFALSQRPYDVSSFQCKGCANVCEINRVKIEGENTHLHYGGRCEKYDVRKQKKTGSLPDLFAFREEMLWREHLLRVKQRHDEVEKRGNDKDKTTSPHYRVTASPNQVTIGIPYVFFFHDYLPFWTTFLWELGFTVEVSAKTNREIIQTGIEGVLADTCFPVKVAHGHITHLVQKGITTLFLPSFVNLNRDEEEFERSYACPLTQTIPYAAQIAHTDAMIIRPIIRNGMEKKALTDELAKAFRPFGIKKRTVVAALEHAESAQEGFSAAIRQKGNEVLSSLKDPTLVIVGRAYNAFDSGINLTIPKKLADLGVMSIPMDFLPLADIRIDDRWPHMYWRSGQRILKAARAIRNNPLLHALFIGNFSCGPDSFILKYFQKDLADKPFLHIEIDEHSADAGALTRCEAFLDSIDQQRGRKRECLRTSQTYRPLAGESVRRRTVFIPRMSDHAFAVAAAFERCGVPAEVLPESDRESVDIGRRQVSGKECYPCTVTTGDMLKKILAADFRPDGSAFFMPSGSGPCRFGQYNVFHRMVLDDLGYHNVPIFSPSQDSSFYRELGVISKDFSLHAWKGIIAIELLTKCLHETRPYETERGSTDRLYEHHLGRLYRSLRGADGSIEASLSAIRKDFGTLHKQREKRPLIGIVGEIFVRSHKFSNEGLITKIEALGGEAWLAPAEEWVYYVNLMGLRKALIKRDTSAIIDFLLKTYFQKRIEHAYARYFTGFLRTVKEPTTGRILKKASRYLHDSFEGEAVLSIGKSVDLVGRGVSGIINAMPFGCMPGTVVTTLMRALTRDFGIPCISIPYDGTESSTTEIQLEAFMSQATGRSEQHAG